MKTEAGNRLGTEKIGKLMLELALPSVLAQIVNVLYNIVDRIYIGRIPGVGAAALTGVGVTFPIITIISAFAGFTNGGGAPLAAIALGQGNKKRAEKILGNSTSLLLFFSVILMALFLIFKCPLLYLFGASAHTISDRNGICGTGSWTEYIYQLPGACAYSDDVGADRGDC